jgi:hypothetical protein
MKFQQIVKTFALASVVAIALGSGAATAEETAGLQVGVITCKIIQESRVNLLIRSTADVDCTWEYAGQVEKYKGETGVALGLDLSFKSDETIAFTVIAASQDVTPGKYALSGKYVGGTADAALGVGVGAKVLVGGGNKNVSLQPLALSGSTGSVGASGGIGFLYIEPAK